ncbi:uncharacterized protein MELLADRAFT_93331 [Melampsora larici-populina 98AG31]|uniref:Uncharacterized protein n=1 Tax=Melampsora larici-populina (strain 98AG31 / pathotype 3-4-7) TaxID=747676 RepID=F4S4T3_MELLP|nr:uncharacterized protein MELLADRAFT_93331 [Melampsora larici-populina 98AG31]EGG00343.1 hypothetical protein MELLADRAFT_93331 [Melampsora larici-populina 98AG31]
MGSQARRHSQQVKAIYPHFYDLDVFMGDQPSETPLDQLESLSDLNTKACMDALGLTSSQASVGTSQVHKEIMDLEDNNTTSDVGYTNDSFDLAPQMIHSALTQPVNQANHPRKTNNPKCFQESLVGGEEESSNSSSSPFGSKKACALCHGTFLKSLGFNDKPDTSPNNHKLGLVTEQLIKFQDTNSKQRKRTLDLQSDVIKGQVSIRETIAGAMLEMTNVLKVMTNPPKDKTTQELDILRLDLEKSDYEYCLANQRAEILDLELKQKAKLIEHFEKSAK